MTTKRAVIIARVSTKAQAKETSLETQLERCREYAVRNGFDVIEELQDTISGTVPIADRPAGKRLYNLIDAHTVNAVILFTNDRTARDDFSIEYLLLKERCYSNGIELHYSDTGRDDNTVTDNITGYIRAQIAAEERRKIAERVTRGKLALAERGKWPVGHVRYGYKRIGKTADAPILIDETKSAVVKRIFRDFIGQGGKKPLGTRSIAVNLNREGIPAPQRGSWSPIKISNIVKCAAYTGRFNFVGIEVPRPELRIVDDDVFASAQDRIERNKRLAERNRNREYLLAGHLVCHCGAAMCGGTVRAANLKEYSYYYCREAHTSSRVEKLCNERAVRVDFTDQRVWAEIEKVLDETSLQRGLNRMAQRKAAELAPKYDRLARIEVLLKLCDTTIARLISDFAHESNEVLQAAAKIEARREATKRDGLVKERDALQAELAQADFSLEMQQRIKTTIAEVRGKVHGATYAKKRYIMDKLDVKLVLRNDKSGRWIDGTCGIANFTVDIIKL
jgi:site-specific DNA recombinase